MLLDHAGWAHITGSVALLSRVADVSVLSGEVDVRDDHGDYTCIQRKIYIDIGQGRIIQFRMEAFAVLLQRQWENFMWLVRSIARRHHKSAYWDATVVSVARLGILYACLIVAP